MRKPLFAAILIWLCVPARAAEHRVTPHFLLDGTVGLSVPIGDSDYLNLNDPTVKLGLRLGVELWLTDRLGLAPELAIDGGPLIDKSTGRSTTGRLRTQAGLRVLFGFGRGHAVFLRALVGAEVFLYGPGGLGGAGKANVGAAVEPGGGMQFRIARRAVAGFSLGFPIGVHSLGTSPGSVNADFDLIGFVGYRM